jgi:DNA mismatch repair ATPase MutS
MRPYTQIHSYLNIPDTSGRDSLFQAESRRCKEILEKIQTDPGRQFCIFDELYSGTNPKEATKAAYAFLEYLRQYHHVDLFLTTHYVSICDEWSETTPDKRAIENYQMVVEETEKRNIPTYKIARGISRIEGAVGILQDMEYPEEMIAMVKNQTSSCSDDEESQEENDNTSVNV